MYQAYGLLRPASTFTLDDAASRLKKRFPDGTITNSGTQITLVKGDWEIEMRLNTDSAVLAESADLAEKIAGTEDGTDIAACARRVEVWSDTPDPMMEYFDDYLGVIEVLRSFPDLIAVDPREPALM